MPIRLRPPEDTRKRYPPTLVKLEPFSLLSLVSLVSRFWRGGFRSRSGSLEAIEDEIESEFELVPVAMSGLDTAANALLTNNSEYETVFLVIVAVPSVVAELWFATWLLARG